MAGAERSRWGEDNGCSQEHVPGGLRAAGGQSGPAQCAEGHSQWGKQRGLWALVGRDVGTEGACTNSFPESLGKFTDLQYPAKNQSRNRGKGL